MASAEKLAPAAISFYSPELVQKLKDIYSKNGNLTDFQLFEIIHQKLGSELMEIVCLPHKLNYGACIVGAIHLLKDMNENSKE